MTLSQWIAINTKESGRPDNYDVITDDIIAQLLGFICLGNDRHSLTPAESSSLNYSFSAISAAADFHDMLLRIDPDNINVFEEASGFLKLEINENVSSSQLFAQLCQNGLLSYDEEADNVLAVGVIYEQLLYGEPFDFQDVAELDENGDLLNRMIVTDPRKRISAKDALAVISKRSKGLAVINYTEIDSGVKVKSVESYFDGCEFLFCPSEKITSEETVTYFYPIDKRERKIYYRAAPVNITVYCTSSKRSDAQMIKKAEPEKRNWVGVDIGVHNIKVSAIDGKGSVYDIYGCDTLGTNSYYPAYAALDHSGQLRFGKEAKAVTRRREGIGLYVFENEPQSIVSFSEGFRLSADELTKKLFENLKKNILKRMHDISAPVSFVYTLPSELGVSKNEMIRSALKQCGFGENELTDAEAVYFWLKESERLKRKDAAVMVIDVGEGAANIGVVRAVSSAPFKPSCQEIVSALGGAQMTDSLANIAKRQIKAEFPDHDRYPDNSAAVHSCAEEMKKSLSFEEKTRRRISIMSGNGVNEVPLLFTRRQLQKEEKAIGECLEQYLSKSGSITDAVLLGGASVMPKIRALVREIVSKSGCELIIIDCPQTVAKGAAAYGFSYPKAKSIEADTKHRYAGSTVGHAAAAKSKNVTVKEIGIQVRDPLRRTPVFTTMIDIGSKYDEEGFVRFDYVYEVTSEEFERRSCSLVIYTREAGVSHVTSTLDDEIGAIKAIGKVVIDIPEKFKLSKERFLIGFKMDKTEHFSVSIIWKRKKWGILSDDSDQVVYNVIKAK